MGSGQYVSQRSLQFLLKWQPEAAKADKVPVCGVWSPHDRLLSEDQLAGLDVLGGHHEPAVRLVPLDLPQAVGGEVTACQQGILLRVTSSHVLLNRLSSRRENWGSAIFTSDLQRYELGLDRSTLPPGIHEYSEEQMKTWFEKCVRRKL